MTSYLPYAGYWFYYPGATGAQTAALYCSFGMLFTAPITGVVMAAKIIYYRFRRNAA